MKHKLSVTLDEQTIIKIQDSLRTGIFRNKSHIVEFALKRLFEEVNNDES